MLHRNISVFSMGLLALLLQNLEKKYVGLN